MTQDQRYSNYTVLETIVNCLKNKNQYFPCEESYSWERQDSEDYEQLQVAENCDKYKEGDGIQFDVDESTESNLNISSSNTVCWYFGLLTFRVSLLGVSFRNTVFPIKRSIKGLLPI